MSNTEINVMYNITCKVQLAQWHRNMCFNVEPDKFSVSFVAASFKKTSNIRVAFLVISLVPIRFFEKKPTVDFSSLQIACKKM